MEKILSIFKRTPKKTSDFSEFFLHAKSAEKKKVLLRAVREANKDQKQLLDRYKAKTI